MKLHSNKNSQLFSVKNKEKPTLLKDILYVTVESTEAGKKVKGMILIW